ncbi:tetraacyldisaccharide 4'-kinase [Gaetbulibacter aestuarii]|uniref:Tetraacyldisaccharide 4'-kinase n=1 Tax=Gaetbulibacter aestuarii TaxID=1502358 RepID=A0ABW7MY90_9FLAO
MKILRILLFPIVPVYYVVTWFRNTFFDLGWLAHKKYDLPVICVGNLSVGGTGKTPMIEYLICLLKDDYKIATLSRGYKRQTMGFQLADLKSNARTIGDEPFQFYHKFNKDIYVGVDAQRQKGISELLKLKPKPEVILLDDAYQHRKVKAGLNILLTTFSQPYFNDLVLPTGNLREPRSGAQRADLIVVTKCPEIISEEEKRQYIKRIDPKEHQSVFFSSILYDDSVYSEDSSIKLHDLKSFTLVTGIANAQSLVDHLKKNDLKFDHLNFKDHHEFSADDIQLLSKKHLIVTTEKDFMRLKDVEDLKGKLYYLPIKVSLEQANNFNKVVKSFVAG